MSRTRVKTRPKLPAGEPAAITITFVCVTTSVWEKADLRPLSLCDPNLGWDNARQTAQQFTHSIESRESFLTVWTPCSS